VLVTTEVVVPPFKADVLNVVEASSALPVVVTTQVEVDRLLCTAAAAIGMLVYRSLEVEGLKSDGVLLVSIADETFAVLVAPSVELISVVDETLEAVVASDILELVDE
jgi:hypothetical protein